MKILIIEDDKTLAQNLFKILKNNGFAVDNAYTKEEGLINLDVNSYDCVVLDVNLPDGSGFDLLDAIRKNKNETPVIIVTARGQLEDKIKGLNLGADDYIPKPVNTNELIARIRSLIRRSSSHALPILTVENLVVKPAEHFATVEGVSLDLTTKEFSVLEYLAQHNREIVTRSMLMEHIWGSDFDIFSNVIDVYIKNLRHEIGKHTKKELIRTIRGKGYILGKDVNDK